MSTQSTPTNSYVVRTYNADGVAWGPFPTLHEALVEALSHGLRGYRYITEQSQGFVVDVSEVVDGLAARGKTIAAVQS